MRPRGKVALTQRRRRRASYAIRLLTTLSGGIYTMRKAIDIRGRKPVSRIFCVMIQ